MNVAVNIRGTGGSGKTVVARTIAKLYESKKPVYQVGRKQPVRYVLSHPDRRPLEMLGHYETACGGCDTLPNLDYIYELVRKALEEGHDVMYEGMLVSEDWRRADALGKDFPNQLHVIHLGTPVNECIDSINERRRRKNPNAAPVKPDNTRNRAKRIRSAHRRLEAQKHVETFTLGRAEAILEIARLLDFGSDAAYNLTPEV